MENKRKGLSRTKTIGALKHSEAEYIQGVGGVTYSKLQHQEIQKKDSNSFVIALFVIQIFFLILYAIWTDYPETGEAGGLSIYGYFRDVNVMIFFGFGFLMTFMRRYAYSAIGYTFLISALVSQWSVLIEGYFSTVSLEEVRFTTWRVGIVQLVNGLFCSGAVMISYGAILGKVTPSQMLILGFVEPLFYWLNIYIVIELLECVDIGGGMVIHTFGAYFGLAVTWFLTSIQTRTHKDNTNSYNSDIFSLAGTIFLWIMWPSFNAAVAPTEITQVRALVNTFIALCSSTMGSFLLTRFLSQRKFDIVHIQNSTLAGGVAMGVIAHLHVTPVGAIVCGFVVSFISVLGYHYLTPWLSKKFNIQDVCGVNNLHGMPGISSCIIGIFVTLAAKESKYGSEYELLFPRGSQQAGYQTAGLFITIGVAVVGGCITGLLMARGWRIAGLIKSDFFNDRTFWTLPSDYENVIDKEEEAEEGEEKEKEKESDEGQDEEKGEGESVELKTIDKKEAKRKEAEKKKEEKKKKEEAKKEEKKKKEEEKKKKGEEKKASKENKSSKEEKKKEEKKEEEKKEEKKDRTESSDSENGKKKKESSSGSGSGSSSGSSDSD